MFTEIKRGAFQSSEGFEVLLLGLRFATYREGNHVIKFPKEVLSTSCRYYLEAVPNWEPPFAHEEIATEKGSEIRKRVLAVLELEEKLHGEKFKTDLGTTPDDFWGSSKFKVVKVVYEKDHKPNVRSVVLSCSDGYEVGFLELKSVAYREGDRVLRFAMEYVSGSSRYYLQNVPPWDPPFDKEPIPEPKKAEIQRRVLAAACEYGEPFTTDLVTAPMGVFDSAIAEVFGKKGNDSSNKVREFIRRTGKRDIRHSC